MRYTSDATQLGLPESPSLFADYLAGDRAFKGIGPKRAAALLNAFGPNIRDALVSIDDRVVEIVGEESAIQAASILETRIPETDFLKWLTELKADIPSHKAIRIARAWGEQGTRAVKHNPYLLLAVSDWKTVDLIASRMGIPRKDIRRSIGAIESALMGKGGLSSGCTLMTLEHVFRRAKRHLGYNIDPNIAIRAVRASAAVRLGDALQPPGAAHMEAGCALLFSQLGSKAPCSGITEEKALQKLIGDYEKHQPFQLTDAQREAIRMSHQHRLLILAGYAGSGKTTVLRGLCETQEAIGKKPIIVTLSGRAAQRAAEATGRRAITVARFLVEEERSSTPPASNRVLIADEASMLGLVEFWRILRRLGDASLVLCGDPAQLPPVSPGIVFHHLADDQKTQKIVLDRVHRQDEATGIPKLAEGIRNGIITKPPSFSGPRPGVSFLNCSRDVLCDEILRVGKEMAKGGVDRNAMQIIAPTNREIDKINSYFHERLLRRKPNLWPEAQHIAEGEPVIWTQNDSKRGLTNGALGRIVRIEGEKIDALIDGKPHILKPRDGQFLQPSWAISVHKAQGSQWPRIIIPVFQSIIVDRSLIYTALTRAQEQIVFVGCFKAIQRAVERKTAAQARNSGFPAWMKLARIFNETN